MVVGSNSGGGGVRVGVGVVEEWQSAVPGHVGRQPSMLGGQRDQLSSKGPRKCDGNRRKEVVKVTAAKSYALFVV